MFIRYIKQYQFIGLLFIVFVVIFGSVLFLYNSDIEAVLYAAVLCFFVTAILIILHFNRFIKKHKNLLECADKAILYPLLVNE